MLYIIYSVTEKKTYCKKSPVISPILQNKTLFKIKRQNSYLFLALQLIKPKEIFVFHTFI